MKTSTLKFSKCPRLWYIVDVNSKVLGRVATILANYIRGKHKPNYTPYTDEGDYVIVLNASKILVTGNKREKKIYYRHSGYVGGLKKVNFKTMITKFPERVVKNAVRGMMPKNSLSKMMLKKLKVYPGLTHTHEAQQAKTLKI